MTAINKILVPIDFSEGSVKILRYADYIATLENAEMHVVYVAEWAYSLSGFPPAGQEGWYDDEIGFAEKRLAGFLAENQEWLKARWTSAVLSGHVAERIIDYAKREGINLIVIGTHGRKGFDRLLLGSVAEKVLKLAPCPVLTIDTYKELDVKNN